jgi:2-polyprenyl-3-methyl-5-hydroxy-6-metoxy-1,4-benzoquinol methylase
MKEIHCPICGEGVGFKVIYQQNLPTGQSDFSARKTPDRYHYRMIKCDQCGLLYSNPILEPEKVNQLYQESKFSYDVEVDNLKETYGCYLKKVENLVPPKENLLEIGCGNGFFLEKALELGYKNVYGVEPSAEAVSKANPGIKDKITPDIFRPQDFQADFFDVICFFQVIEHITDINSFLKGCWQCLKTGGVILVISHNVDSFLSRILKDRCPIINDEHIYVFSKKTMPKIFAKHNFKVIEIGSVKNIYSLNYWFKMLPLPKSLKTGIFKLFSSLKLGNKKIKINGGNIFLVAQK